MVLREGTEESFIHRVLIGIALVVLTLLGLLLVYYAFDVILLVFAGIMLAIFLRGLADILGRYVHVGEGWLVMLVATILLALLAGTVALLSPSVAEQVGILRQELPRSIQAAGVYISGFGWGRAILDQLPSSAEFWNAIGSSGMLTRVGGIFSSTIGGIANFFIAILLAIYLAAEPQFYARGFTKLFPVDRRRRVMEILVGISETLRWWLIGKAGSMLFIGILTWIGLWALGIPLALTLGIIAGLLSFIPNFGPILSALPAILIAFIHSPISAVYVAGLYVLVQLIESNIVTPLIERETVELPPALTIMFQLSLAVMVGGLGLVLATPLLAVIMTLVQMVYIEDVLGDRQTKFVQEEIVDKEAPAEAGTVGR